jgi:catechol-2,3-dioxygenase
VINGLIELALEVDDLEAATTFYANVLDLELVSRDSDRTWLKVGDRVRLGLWTPGEKEFGDRGGRHVHFAFSVAAGGLIDLSERLRRAGVHVRGPVEHDGGDRSIYFKDPAGNLVEAWDALDSANDGEGALGE